MGLKIITQIRFDMKLNVWILIFIFMSSKCEKIARIGTSLSTTVVMIKSENSCVRLQGQKSGCKNPNFSTADFLTMFQDHFYNLIKHTWCIQKWVNNDGNEIIAVALKLQFFVALFLQCVAKISTKGQRSKCLKGHK